MKGSYNEDTIKVKVSVDYDRQRSVDYQKLCQQVVSPLDEACQRCTKINFLVTDGVLLLFATKLVIYTRKLRKHLI